MGEAEYIIYVNRIRLGNFIYSQVLPKTYNVQKTDVGVYELKVTFRLPYPTILHLLRADMP